MRHDKNTAFATFVVQNAQLRKNYTNKAKVSPEAILEGECPPQKLITPPQKKQLTFNSK